MAAPAPRPEKRARDPDIITSFKKSRGIALRNKFAVQALACLDVKYSYILAQSKMPNVRRTS